MDRYERDRYQADRYNPQHRNQHDHNIWQNQDRHRENQHAQHYRGHDQHRFHPDNNRQDYNQYDNNGQDRNTRLNDSHRYRRDQDGRHPYQTNFSRNQDQFGDGYQDNFRHDPTMPRGGEDDDLMGNIRQGYGISSYDGTSDRFNTLNSEQRYGDRQDEQAYYNGSQNGYRSSQFGAGAGDAATHSDRGIPNYGIRPFSDHYGSGLGSSYGGTNYGGGRGYTGGHQGGTWGDNSYGTNSGNLGGYGPMGGSTYGGGRGSYGSTSSQNNSRGDSEVGGF